MPHSSYVNHARFSHDGNYVVTAAQDGRARIWFLAQEEPERFKPHLVAVLEHGEGLQQASFIKSGEGIVTVGYLTPKTLTGDPGLKRETVRSRIWDVSPGSISSVAPVIAARQFDRDRQELVPLTSQELIDLWRAGEPEYRKQFEPPGEESQAERVVSRGRSD